jgi:hypothetical protein
VNGASPTLFLGDLANNPPLDAVASALASALAGGATQSTMNGICSAFQSAYNAAGGSPQIQVDDYYGPCTQAALQAYYDAQGAGSAPASAYPGACSNGTYQAPPGTPLANTQAAGGLAPGSSSSSASVVVAGLPVWAWWVLGGLALASVTAIYFMSRHQTGHRSGAHHGHARRMRRHVVRHAHRRR